MPYSITTKDGITIQNIPDDIAPDSDVLRQRVAQIRQEQGGQNGLDSAGVSVPPVELPQDAQPSRPDSSGFLDFAGDVAKEGIGNLEALATVASGIIAEPLSGLAGIGAAIVPGGQSGAEAVKSVQESMTYQPRTDAGAERVQQLGSIAEYIPDIAGGAGDLTYDLTGSPLASAGVSGAVAILPELIGLGTVRKIKTGTRLLDQNGRPTKALRKALDDKGLNYDNLSDQAKKQIPVVADQSFVTGTSLVPASTQKALVEQIKSGGKDDALAGLKVVKNQAVPDSLGIEAMKQGYAPGFVQSVKTATPQTKNRMREMLNISRRIKKSERTGLDVRPGDVVGRSVTDRVKHIRNVANDARNELDSIATQQLKGQQIDTSIVRDQLQKSMDDLDVTLIEGPNGVPTPQFKGSIISKDASSQKAIKDAISLLAEGGEPDALRAHKLKRQLDNIIDFNKKASTGLGEEGRNVLKDIRHSLNESVRVVSDDYARVNDTLRKSLTALDDFDKATGSSIDVFAKGADSAIGTKMRGLMSNIQSRVKLENSVNQLDDVALELGANFGDDVKDLAMFANALDARFGAVAKTSFQGNIEQAINRVLNQGVSQEIFQQGASKLAGTANKMRGINEFNALETMEELLKIGQQ